MLVMDGFEVICRICYYEVMGLWGDLREGEINWSVEVSFLNMDFGNIIF